MTSEFGVVVIQRVCFWVVDGTGCMTNDLKLKLGWCRAAYAPSQRNQCHWSSMLSQHAPCTVPELTPTWSSPLQHVQQPRLASAQGRAGCTRQPGGHHCGSLSHFASLESYLAHHVSTVMLKHPGSPHPSQKLRGLGGEAVRGVHSYTPVTGGSGGVDCHALSTSTSQRRKPSSPSFLPSSPLCQLHGLPHPAHLTKPPLRAGMLRRRTPEPAAPVRTSRQPPAMAGAVESPRDSPEDGERHDSDAIDLSLLKLYDGQWMGAGHDAARRHDATRRQSLPAADVRPSPVAALIVLL